jgi:hypothetical protein
MGPIRVSDDRAIELRTEDTAAPIKNAPTVNGANIFDAPVSSAARGPTVYRKGYVSIGDKRQRIPPTVKRVDVVKVSAQQSANFITSDLSHVVARSP